MKFRMDFHALTISLGFFLIVGCKKNVPDVNYADEMRDFVKEISAEAKSTDPDFLIIPQNGCRLATIDRSQEGALAVDYLAAIDGQGQEELFYGYNNKDGKSTPESIKNELIHFLNIMEGNGIEVLATDYFKNETDLNTNYKPEDYHDYISFGAEDRELTSIPTLIESNAEDIHELSEAQNFLYLINPGENFGTKEEYLSALKATNYDLLIIDRDFNAESLTHADVKSLKTKQNGARRLVIAYMSIGEAEIYRSYWDNDWCKGGKNRPEWLYRKNRRWAGNYKVFYWMPAWKNIIYGNPKSYLTSLLNRGFDGTYLDIVDAYEYYEEL